jgi:hypothetical protein
MEVFVDYLAGCFLKLIAWTMYVIAALLICGFLISIFSPK